MVKRLIHDLNVHKSLGPDGIHPRFMQELLAELCIPLTMIFENSIESAQLPDQWKVARVSAIFKKGNKKLASNYRPVSTITSIVCRTFEKIIRDHIVSLEYSCSVWHPHKKSNKGKIEKVQSSSICFEQF